MESDKCKYNYDGICYFHITPDCKDNCGSPGLDCVHICEMEGCCFDDAIIELSKWQRRDIFIEFINKLRKGKR